MKSKGVCACMCMHVCTHACVCFCTDRAENTFQLLPPSVFTLLLPSSTHTHTTAHSTHKHTLSSSLICCSAYLLYCLLSCCSPQWPCCSPSHHTKSEMMMLVKASEEWRDRKVLPLHGDKENWRLQDSPVLKGRPAEGTIVYSQQIVIMFIPIFFRRPAKLVQVQRRKGASGYSQIRQEARWLHTA